MNRRGQAGERDTISIYHVEKLDMIGVEPLDERRPTVLISLISKVRHVEVDGKSLRMHAGKNGVHEGDGLGGIERVITMLVVGSHVQIAAFE